MNKSFFFGALLALTTLVAHANTDTYNINVANSLDTLVQKIKEFKEQNPNATDNEVEAYTEKLLANNIGDTPTIQERVTGSSKPQGLDGYAQGVLNEQEKKLYKENKAKALICISNGVMAVTTTNSRYTQPSHNHNGDAFRHALWNFTMARDVGADFAKRWADAHEYGATTQPALEQQMDLYNNEIGRAYAKVHTSKRLTIPYMADIVQKDVRNGKMKIIINKKLVKSSSAGEKK